MKYKLVVIGGGTSGIAAAYIASKSGINTLLVESTDVLGGAITQGLVIPTMKVDTMSINTDFFNDLLKYSTQYKAQATYKNKNKGWFNPELLKIVFDRMLKDVRTSILFSSHPTNCNYDSHNNLFNIELKHKLLSIYIEAEYIIDATANGEIFKILNYDFQPESKTKQSASLRFNLSGIDIEKFNIWLQNIDKDRDVTSFDNTNEQFLLSTACTWDESRKWALLPIFKKAVEAGDLEYEDTAYFQVFSVPYMPATLAVNAPRVILDDDEDLLDPFIYSRAVMQGRERIYRLWNFCKKYFPGFENSYIGHISDTLGVRESYRIKGKYTFTKEDILLPKKFENTAFACDYPIDIHSSKKNNDKLEFSKQTYYIPIDTLISINNDRLYGVGRIISADFESQAALRTQMSCFSMGEAAAKDIKSKLV